VSRTLIFACFDSGLVRTETAACPPDSIAWRAFTIRFIRHCWTCPELPQPTAQRLELCHKLDAETLQVRLMSTRKSHVHDRCRRPSAVSPWV